MTVDAPIDPAARSHVPTRYGDARYGPPRYGYRPYGQDKPGTKRK